MKTEIISDQCKAPFQGEEWLMEKPGNVLCTNCYDEGMTETL